MKEMFPSGLLHLSQGDVVGLEASEIQARIERESAMENLLQETLPELEMSDVDELLKIVDEEQIEALVNEMDGIEMENLPRAARAQEIWAMGLFAGVALQKGLNCDFSVCSIEDAAVALRVLYAFVRRQDGGLFSPSSLICMRAGIFRVVQRMRGWNIIADPAFSRANTMLRTTAGLFVKAGGRVKQFATIERSDLQKLRQYFDRTTPSKLQEEVYFAIALHFGLRGREWLRQLQVSSFERVSVDGVRAFKLKPMESKTVHGSLESRSAEEMKQSVLAETGGPGCPYAALDLYLQKICESKRDAGVDHDDFFLRPRIRGLDKSWYFAKQVIGRNTLCSMMATISMNANLSKRYTGHCIRATLVTELHDAGVPIADIGKITGHKTQEATQRYIRRTPKRDADMARLSTVISGVHQPLATKDEVAVVPIEGGAPIPPAGGLDLVTPSSDCHRVVSPTLGSEHRTGQFRASAITGTFNHCTFNVHMGHPSERL